MPLETKLKPRIKQAELPPGGSVPCADCGATTANHMVEAYVVAAKEEDDHPTASQKELCGSCLVGHDVAANRGGGKGWSFGEVIEYNENLLTPFLLSFLSGDEEWVQVSRTPTADYLNFVGSNQPTQNLLAKESIGSFSVEESIGSFSASTFSEISSTNAGETFQLYDDQNIMHMSHSFPNFDETIFSGDGGLEFPVNDEEETEVQPKNGDPLASALKSGRNKTGKGKKKTKMPKQGLRTHMPKPGPRIPTTPEGATRVTSPRTPRTPMMWNKEEDILLLRVVNFYVEKNEAFGWQEVSVSCGGWVRVRLIKVV